MRQLANVAIGGEKMIFLSNMVLLHFREQINIKLESLYKIIYPKFVWARRIGQTKFLPQGKYITCLLRNIMYL